MRDGREDRESRIAPVRSLLPSSLRHFVTSSPMLSFCVLGSGSAGNSTLVALGGNGRARYVLIDSGLSPRATARRLGPLGVRPAEIGDIVLTHLDRDHVHPGWISAVRRHCLAVHVHQRHRHAALRAGLPAACLRAFGSVFRHGEGTEIETTLLGHDQLGSVGLVLEHAGLRLGFATDLGRVPETLLERLVGLHALAIESNYDRPMQTASDRPAALKRRIMGGLGHLSNEQSLAAVLRVAEQGDLGHIALLHLSRQCNDPRLVRTLYARHAPHLLSRLTLSSQDRPTPWLHLRRPERIPRMAVAAGRQLNFLEMLPAGFLSAP